MNKSILLIVILQFLVADTFAQEVEMEISKKQTSLYAGFIYAPAAVISFEESIPVFVGSSLYFAVALGRGDWSVAPYYNLGTNNLGTFVTYNITDQIGSYVVFDKSLSENSGNATIGLTTTAGADFIQLFAELGSTYGNDSQQFFATGIYFNIFKTMKTWK